MKRILSGFLFFFAMVFCCSFSVEAKTYLIGDSRTNGMKIAVGEQEGVEFVAQDGAGYSWMVNTALPSVQGKFTEGDQIVITMGGNDAMDFNQVKAYVKTVNDLAEKYPDCAVYYVSVNPVKDLQGTTLSNKQIDDWNAYMRENLSDDVVYLDTNTHIEFQYTDWLHYDAPTNKAVFDWILAQLIDVEDGTASDKEKWAEYARIALAKSKAISSNTIDDIKEIKIETFADNKIPAERHQIKGIVPHPIAMVQPEFKELGVRQVAYNMYLSEMLNANGGETVAYEYNGKTYQFSQEWLNSYDFLRNFFTVNGYETTMILLCDAQRANPLIHPSAIGTQANVYSFSDTPEALEQLQAMGAFLGSRYPYVKNWIIGNEIDAYGLWNYMKHDSFDEYMQTYTKVFQAWYKGLREGDADAELFIPLTANWTMKIKNQYPARDVLIDFAKKNKDIEWGVAHHPYNMPLLDPTSWNGEHVRMSVNTPAITMQNIDVLTSFMGTKEMLEADGSRRPIILSEFGYTSQRSEQDQAASIVYSYQQALKNPYISAYLYTREMDHALETRDGLFSGLRTLASQKKLSWSWYAAMGTEKEADILAQAAAYIGDDEIIWVPTTFDGSTEADVKQATDYGRIVFFGDSRTIDMFADSDANIYGESHDGIVVYGGHGKGYGFLQQELDKYGYGNFDTLVSFMGANDRGNFKNYQTYYEGLLAQGKKLVLCTVGPTVDWRLNAFDAPNYPNSNMEYYNKQLTEWANAHGVKVIDTYTFIKDNITVDADGIHYTPRPTTALWQYILTELAK